LLKKSNLLKKMTPQVVKKVTPQGLLPLVIIFF